MPDAPTLREPPEAPIGRGLLARAGKEEEWEAYQARLQIFEKDRKAFIIAAAEYQKAYDLVQANIRKKIDEISKAAEVGEEIAEEKLGLLSDQE